MTHHPNTHRIPLARPILASQSLPLGRALLLALTLLSLTACRATHEASEAELATLSDIGTAIQLSGSVPTNNGQDGIGAIYAIYPLLMAMTDPDTTEAAGFALHSHTLNDVLTTGYIPSRLRASWPECLEESDSTVSFIDCDFVLGSGATIAFTIDGSWAWTPNSSDSDLHYDLTVGLDDLGYATRMSWSGHSEWTADTYDGRFDLTYTAGIELGQLDLPSTAIEFRLRSTFDTLTFSDTCDQGPTFGKIDWHAVLKSPDATDRRHVTIEFTDCGAATITW